MASRDGSSSGGSLFGAIAGGIIGFFVGGGIQGAVKGFMYGSTIGGLLAPPTGPDQVGPRLDSLQLTTSSNVAIIPRSYGTVAHRGNLIWAKNGEYIEVATTKKVRTGLFSKTKVTTYSYYFTGAYAFHKGEIENVLRIWHAGGRDLVYNASSEDTDTIIASGDLTKYITIYKGTADQIQDPLMAEDVGIASCSAYRGIFYIVYDMYPLADYQNNVGNLDPKVEYTTKTSSVGELDHLVDVRADSEGTSQDLHDALHNATNMDADGVHLWRIGKAISPAVNYTETSERYHYTALPSGQLMLRQIYEEDTFLLSADEQFHPYTKACHGKSDRNVFVSTRGYIRPGEGPGGSISAPVILIPGNWQVTLHGFWSGDPPGPTYPVSSFHEGLRSVIEDHNGPGSSEDPDWIFGDAFQEDLANGIRWRDSAIGLARFSITYGSGSFYYPYPVTSGMYDGDGTFYFVRFEIRLLDVDNNFHIEYIEHVDATSEIPSEQTHYAFYKENLYFLYSYTTGYVILKINPAGGRVYGDHALSAESVVKMGILNDQLIVVVTDGTDCNLDIYALDNLELEDNKDSSEVATLFGDSASDFYNSVSFDFDKVYYCLSGNMYRKDSLTATAEDLGAHTGLILGTSSPALFNIFGSGSLLADSTSGGAMPNVGVQFFTNGIVADPGKVLLADIITAECALVGLEAVDIDVTTIDQQVRGYTVSERGSVRNVLAQLQGCFPFDIIQSGYKLKFVKRGTSSVAGVSWEELGQDVSLTQDREMETQLPRIVRVKYLDKSLTYEANEQFSERPSGSDNETTLNIPIVFLPDEAAQTADILHSIYNMERVGFAFTLPMTFRHLEPADIITLNMPLATHTVRLTNINYAGDGSLTCAAKRHLPSGYISVAVGASGPERPDTIPSIANPIPLVLDIPVINDIQNAPGYTALVSHPSDTWIGGALYRARDGVTYEMVQAFSISTIWGTCQNALSAHGGHLIDEGSELTVRPLSGEIDSVTEASMLSEETLLAYGATGRWELIAFQNAVDNEDGTYTLSRFLRGRRGTEWASGQHQVGDYFAFVNDGTAKFVSALDTDIDTTLTHKAVTTGRDLESASSVDLIYGGENLMPLSPVQASGYRDSNDNLFASFIRRSRLNGGLNMLNQIYLGVPLGETTEAYEIDIMDGEDVVRTIETTTEAFEYSAADQTTDFGTSQASIDVQIYQISATVGRGRVLEATL